MKLFEDFIDNIDVEDVKQNDSTVLDKEDGDYEVSVVLATLHDKNFYGQFYPFGIVREFPEKARAYARRAELCLESVRDVKNVKFYIRTVKNNKFVLNDVTNESIYSNLKGDDVYRGFCVTFDIAGEVNVSKMVRALCSLYKLAYDMIFKVFGMSLENIIYLSKYLLVDGTNGINGQICSQIKNQGTLSGTGLKYIRCVINDVFETNINSIDILNAIEAEYKKDYSSYQTLWDTYKMPIQEAKKFFVGMTFTGNDEKFINLKLNKDCVACLDEYDLKEMTNDYINKIELTVEGTLVINSMIGFENLNYISMTSRNNKLKIATRVTARILDWILRHLWFDELDLSKAKVSKEIQIYPKDKGMRNKDIKIIPNQNIIIKEEE